MRRIIVLMKNNVKPLICSFLVIVLHKFLEYGYVFVVDYYSIIEFSDIHKKYQETAIGWPQNNIRFFLQEYLPSEPIVVSYSANPEDNNNYPVGTVSLDVTEQAIKTGILAIRLAELGKDEKASKLFDHALSLNSKHPDILNSYGVFLERNMNDMIRAEHMYCKALQFNHKHIEARNNKERVSSIVVKLDELMFQRIKRKKELVLKAMSGSIENAITLQKAHHELFLQHIHHTAALEGNTFSIDEARALMETGRAIGGKSVTEHNELLGIAEALLFLNSTLLQKLGDFDVKDILDLHRHIMGHADPRSAGQIRTKQVFVSKHVPPKSHLVDALLKDLTKWINSNLRAGLNDIKLAALTHYKLVYIHPFADGNGRTSRLLMNAILIGSGYPIVNIGLNEKHEYYSMLQMANDGDVRPFIRFIARCTERTLNDLLWMVADTKYIHPTLSLPASDRKYEEQTMRAAKRGKVIGFGDDEENTEKYYKIASEIRDMLMENDEDNRFQEYRQGKELFIDLQPLRKTKEPSEDGIAKYEEVITLHHEDDDSSLYIEQKP